MNKPIPSPPPPPPPPKKKAISPHLPTGKIQKSPLAFPMSCVTSSAMRGCSRTPLSKPAEATIETPGTHPSCCPTARVPMNPVGAMNALAVHHNTQQRLGGGGIRRQETYVGEVQSCKFDARPFVIFSQVFLCPLGSSSYPILLSLSAVDWANQHACSGYGKRETGIDWFMVMPEKAAPVTGTILMTTGPVPAESRQ